MKVTDTLQTSSENLFITNSFSGAASARHIRRNQNGIYYPMRLLAKLLNRGSRIELELSDLQAHKGYVIAANHQSRIDPFFISTLLPRSYWNHLTPFRYFAYTELFRNFALRNFLRACGAFPTRAFRNHPFGLTFAFQALAHGQTIFIFPEGKRTRPGQSAKPGVAMLAQAPHAEIIPAHIEWQRHGWLRTFRLHVGKPFNGAGMTADEIMARIYALPVD